MKDIQLISKLCSKYPKKLLSLENSPDVIYAVGNLNLLDTFSLAVVGSRACTMEAKALTEKLVKELATLGITIISGMANGIDSLAHETALNCGGNTIAILGSGFEVAKGKKILKKILDGDGLILSEYSPKVPALKYHFPQRNSLISGLSDGVIITEARKNSGTLLTAQHALNQHKPLFTFPWNIDNENYYGNNLILTKGARGILSYKDIIDFYPKLNLPTLEKISQKTIPEEYKNIYKTLKNTPIPLEVLAQKTNIPLRNLQSTLTFMELDGYIKKMPNNSYIKI